MTLLIRCLAMHQVHRNFAKRFDHSRLLQELRRTSEGNRKILERNANKFKYSYRILFMRIQQPLWTSAKCDRFDRLRRIVVIAITPSDVGGFAHVIRTIVEREYVDARPCISSKNIGDT
jgi:hypothetical protein